MKYSQYKKTFKEKVLNLLNIKSALAEDYMGTVTQNTGTSLDNGYTAQKLDNMVRVVYSKEVMFKATPIMKFLQFAKEKTELGVEPGLTISMMTYNNLKRGKKLTEGKKLNSQALSSSMKQITVSEYGNAVSISELALKTTFTDAMADATSLLGRDVGITFECELRDTIIAGVTNTVFGRADKNSPKVTARKDVTATNVFSTAVVKDAVEILSTANAPKFEGSYFIAFVHPHQSRDLRDDSTWIEASKYGAPEQLFTGEIGRIDDVRFIETTLMPNGAMPVDDDGYSDTFAQLQTGAGEVGSENKVDIYQSVIFGEDTYGYAISLPVEIRDNGVEDFGRSHSLAWYSICGFGVLHEERGVVIETA